MQETDLLGEGLNLLLLGMGTVFVFLTILVMVTTLMSTLVQRYFPEALSLSEAKLPASQAADTQLVAVISAAIKAHQNRNP